MAIILTVDLSHSQIGQLKRVGFWYSKEEPDLPHPGEYIDWTWDRDEKDKVIRYLQESYVLTRFYCDYPWCRLYCDFDVIPEIGYREYTDGTWLYPEGLLHYVLRHMVKPPSDFLEHVRRRNYKVAKPK